MKTNLYFSLIALLCICVTGNGLAKTTDLTESMKQSLVFLEISSSSYDLSQPWKRGPISKSNGYGCAVGPYEILTTASNAVNATLIQTRRYGQNTYIPAQVKIVDYEYNLCLLELDKDAAQAPLTPLSFTKSYPKGKHLTSYWLSAGNHITTARSTLDRAEMQDSDLSFAKNLTFFATNVSRPFGGGEVCCYEDINIGIAFWGTDSDSGIIPSESINRFLSHCNRKGYSGFAAAGFAAHALLDPTMRSYLKIPDKTKHGIYVSTVYSIGTGSAELKQADVILSIDGHQLNPYGRYEHPEYNRISFHHLLSRTPAGEKIPFEIFRDGKPMTLEVLSRNIASDNMLVPSYLYGKQTEYIVIGGFVFQTLTRDYLSLWGSDWNGKAPPHLYHYYSNLSFKPSNERKDIVFLSYVLPAEINLGYQQLSKLVVDSVNGKKIASMKDFVNLVNKSDDSEAIRITFEMDSPVLVIPREHLNAANMQIAQRYGIPQMMHLDD